MNNKNKEEEEIDEEKTILYKYTTNKFQDISRKKGWSFEKDENKNCSEKAEQMVNILKNSIETFKKQIKIIYNVKNKWFDEKIKRKKKK